MKRRFWVLILFLAFCCQAESYAIAPADSLKLSSKNTLWFNGFALLGNTVELSYERKLAKRFAIEAGTGYKYPQPMQGPLEAEYYAHGPHQALSYYYRMVESAPFAKGWSGYINLKYYPLNYQKGLYFSVNSFLRNRNYQHREVNNTNLGGGSDEDRWDSQQSLDLKVYGFSFLPGYVLEVVPFRNGNAIFIDVFTGISQNYFLAETDFDWKVNMYTIRASREEQKQNSRSTVKIQFEVPRIMAGFKVGYRF